MSQAQRTQKSPLAPNTELLDPRSARAWTEPMSVRRLPDGRYVIETDSGGTYVVDLEEALCSCPDHEIRKTRCKHLRRVAIEVTRGQVEPP